MKKNTKYALGAAAAVAILLLLLRKKCKKQTCKCSGSGGGGGTTTQQASVVEKITVTEPTVVTKDIPAKTQVKVEELAETPAARFGAKISGKEYKYWQEGNNYFRIGSSGIKESVTLADYKIAWKTYRV